MLHLDISFLQSDEELNRWCTRTNMKLQLNQLLQAQIYSSLWYVWKAHNRLIFEGIRITKRQAVMKIKKFVLKLGSLMNRKVQNNVFGSILFQCFGTTLIHTAGLRHKDVLWVAPLPRWHHCNTDRVAKGNLATFGGVFRNFSGFFVGFLNSHWCSKSNLCQTHGIYYSSRDFLAYEWFPLWFESDS